MPRWKKLGVRLFDRDTRGVQLTPDGHKVLEYADRMVSTLHQLQAAVAQRPGFEGRVRVGAMDSVIHTWLSPLIARTAEMFPALEIELVADSAMHLVEHLQKGALDIAFQTDLLRAESVRNVQLAQYPIHWVVATNSGWRTRMAVWVNWRANGSSPSCVTRGRIRTCSTCCT